MASADETVFLRIPTWVREEIIDLAFYASGTDPRELWEAADAALRLFDSMRSGAIRAAVSADHLAALLVIAEHRLAAVPLIERQGWVTFLAAVQDGHATLSNEILWRWETIYQHIVGVRSNWIIQPSGSKCRVHGIRNSLSIRSPAFVCWVEAGNGRKLGVLPDTAQPYGREALGLRIDQVEAVGNLVLRALRAGSAARYPWPLGLPYVDYPKPEPLSVAPFAYGEPAGWFKRTD